MNKKFSKQSSTYWQMREKLLLKCDGIGAHIEIL